MAVQPQTPYKEYTANGSTKSFALEFDCENQDHLIVLVDDMEPVVGTWSLSNGAVVFNTAPTNGKKITIQRNTPFRRDEDFQSYDNSFRPPGVNKGFDKIWLKLQELGVADWILSNRIDALKSYVNQQDGILQDNIDSLKNYVDDKDDELRNYLLNAIQEQGVALDQLEEYYSYLMQQLAQVAIDRGWAASFIVSADGSTQQEINDFGGAKWRNKPLGYDIGSTVKLENGDIVKSTVANNIINPNVDMTGWVLDHTKTETILTIEMFGGKSIAIDPSFDNSNAFDKLFGSYYALHGITSGITFNQLQDATQTTRRVVVQLNGMYRHTRPINLPPNTTLKQPFDGYFAKAPSAGLFYDPVDLNSYALGGVLYKKQVDGTYTLDTNVMTLVTGFQFDNGEYFMAAARQQLINTFIVTKRKVTLAYRLMGWAGNYASNIGCGENNGDTSRNPKVAILTGCVWGAKIDRINTLSLYQGHVQHDAGGGFTINEAYINSGALDSGEVRGSVVPVYTVAGHTEAGTIGLTQFGECYYHNPAAENWSIGHLATTAFHIYRPHMERIDKHGHYLINCEGVIDFKGVTPVEALSIIYLKNYRDFNREVRVQGSFYMGGDLVTGENSDPSVVLDILHPHSFIQFYKWGDVNLVKSVINKWDVSVYVDSINGNDTFVGLRDIRALKTLTHAKKLCELFDTNDIILLNNLTVSASVDMPNKFTITGDKILTLNSFLRIPKAGIVEFNFKNSAINGSTATALLFNTGFNKGYLNIQCDISLPSATLLQTVGDLDLDVNITNTTTNFSLISYCPVGYKVAAGWSVKTVNYTNPYRFDGGGGYFKSISNTLSVGNLAVASQNIAPNVPVVFDIPVKAAQVGDAVSAAYSGYVAGLIYNAVVDANGNVKVGIRNSTGSTIALPSGTITTKMI